MLFKGIPIFKKLEQTYYTIIMLNSKIMIKYMYWALIYVVQKAWCIQSN